MRNHREALMAAVARYCEADWVREEFEQGHGFPDAAMVERTVELLDEVESMVAGQYSRLTAVNLGVGS